MRVTVGSLQTAWLASQPRRGKHGEVVVRLGLAPERLE